MVLELPQKPHAQRTVTMRLVWQLLSSPIQWSWTQQDQTWPERIIGTQELNWALIILAYILV